MAIGIVHRDMMKWNVTALQYHLDFTNALILPHLYYSKSVCDGLIDCLTGIDEMNCDFPSMACPQTCTCIAYGIVCQKQPYF